MTRKDCELLALVIRSCAHPWSRGSIDKVELLGKLSIALEKDNPRFDHKQFALAAGGEL